jgi:glycosyltransferase involved in cell wall biosynthesis
LEITNIVFSISTMAHNKIQDPKQTLEQPDKKNFRKIGAIMTDLPSISLITPTYNQAGYIEQTIESVISQNYPYLEYIVIDGGSTDGTLDILNKYGNKYFWMSEKDRGQSDALNKGMKIAKGDIIGFINSDDILAPQSLWKVGRFFLEHPEAYWLTGKCRTIDENGNEIRKLVTLYKNIWVNTRSLIALKVMNYISQPATFWRRDVMENVGYFNETYHYSMEYDLWMRIGSKYSLFFLPEYLASFRIHPSSKAGSSAKEPFDADLEIMKHYSHGPLLPFLHAVHNSIIVFIYRKILAGKSGLYSKSQGE